MKNVVITGSATGLGQALSVCFLRRGWRVWGSYHHSPHEAAFERCYAGQFVPFYLDAGREASVAEAALHIGRQLEAYGGRVNLLINNAACFSTGPLMEARTEELLQEYRVNVLAPLLMVRHFRPLFDVHSGSEARIVHISSFISRIPLPFIGSYAASKNALNTLHEVLDMELIPYGLRSVNILLGMVQTGTVERQLKKLQSFEHSAYRPYLEMRAAKAKHMNTHGYQTEAAAERIAQIACRPGARGTYVVARYAFLMRLLALFSGSSLFRYCMKKWYFTLSSDQQPEMPAPTTPHFSSAPKASQ